MDILNADPQKLIDDAAKQIDPKIAMSESPPPSQPPEPIDPNTSSGTPPPLLKEEALLPSQPESPAVNTPLPLAPAAPPTPTDDSLSPPEPSSSNQPNATKTYGGVPPDETLKDALPPPPPEKKKGMGKGVILAGLLLLLATLPVAVYYISQQQKQVAETRSKAAICARCDAGTCPNGLAYGASTCSPVPCGRRITQICGIATTPSPTPLPIEALQLVAGTISGKICRDKVKASGAVYFFNVDRNTVQFIPVTATDTSYSKKLIPGNYGIQFQSDTDQTPLGYTNIDHNLTLITLGVRQNLTNIDLCDINSTGPGANFTSEDLIVQ